MILITPRDQAAMWPHNVVLPGLVILSIVPACAWTVNRDWYLVQRAHIQVAVRSCRLVSLCNTAVCRVFLSADVMTGARTRMCMIINRFWFAAALLGSRCACHVCVPSGCACAISSVPCPFGHPSVLMLQALLGIAMMSNLWTLPWLLMTMMHPLEVSVHYVMKAVHDTSLPWMRANSRLVYLLGV